MERSRMIDMNLEFKNEDTRIPPAKVKEEGYLKF